MSYRIGLLVPSSNVTMETELPELFRRRELLWPARFTFHSARAQLTSVTPAALAAMNEAADRSAAELADADCDGTVPGMRIGRGGGQRREPDCGDPGGPAQVPSVS